MIIDNSGNCFLAFVALETYSMSFENRLCADDERQRINEAKECELAATQMKIKFVEKRSRKGLPKGCYFLIENDLIYFNTHLSGSKSTIAQQVCKGIGKEFEHRLNSVSMITFDCFIIWAE